MSARCFNYIWAALACQRSFLALFLRYPGFACLLPAERTISKRGELPAFKTTGSTLRQQRLAEINARVVGR